MTYVTESLLPEERIVYHAKVAWLSYLPLIATCLLLTLPFALSAPWLFVLDAAVVVYAWAVVHSTELAITDRRILAKAGLLSRTAIELPLSKVESVLVSQSLRGRLLGYGTVVFRGTGGVQTPFSDIADPMALRNATTRAMDDVATRRRRHT